MLRLWFRSVSAGVLTFASLAPATPGESAPRAAEEQQTRMSVPARATVRVIRQSTPESCGAWGAMVLEACQPMPSCSPERIGQAQIAPLTDALRDTASRRMESACDGNVCGASRSRNDRNSFACRGSSQLCMTRTLEFSCTRSASVAANAPERATADGPRRVPDRPRRTAGSPQSSSPVPATTSVPERRPTALPQPATQPQRTSAPAGTVFLDDAAAVYHLQAIANDMQENERYFTRDHAETTTQKFGFDISMRRYTDDGTWSSLKDGVKDHWDDPKNESYVIYNKPFYAMRDGTIIGCWRNAPNNPRPKLPSEDADTIPFADKKWLHKDYRARLIPGGGNSLWIKHDDGTYALYAHAAPGSIPAALCPNSKTIMDAPTPEDAPLHDGVVGPATLLPAAQRARVKAGDFLGRVGNSGNSTGPHTHIHVQKKNAADKWEGIPIVFARGLATPWKDGKASLDDWTSFSGKTMPKGEILFWPPTRLSKEYARHGLPAADLQRTFSHLANSGFAPEVLDCSSAGGNVYYNMVWRPSTGAWRAHFGMTADTIEDKFADAKADGLHPVYIDSCTSKNGPRYAAIFEKTGGLYWWRYAITAEAHQTVFEKAKAEGLEPVNVSVISVNGQRHYTSLFRNVNYGSMVLRSQLGHAQYQQEVLDNKAAGRKPVYVAAYIHNGQPHFSAIFAQKPAGEWRARHDLNGSAYQAEWADAVKDGYLTRTLSGYDGANSFAFAVVWRK
jgi:hypothetical protein